MGKRVNNTHEFYCMKCGQKGIPISRPRNLQREKFHRKKLYCIHCKEEVNHIECRNEYEVMEFLQNFEEGLYEEEANESLSYVRGSGFGENNLG